METLKFVKNVTIILCALVVTLLLLSFVKKNVKPSNTPEDILVEDMGEVLFMSEKGVSIYLESPKENQKVESPIYIKGRAPGNWFFEASAPVTLTDANGVVLAEHYMSAEGEWMTTNHVPFSGTINFSNNNPTDYGYLIFRKDNASGEPQFDDSFKVKVFFN